MKSCLFAVSFVSMHLLSVLPLSAQRVNPESTSIVSVHLESLDLNGCDEACDCAGTDNSRCDSCGCDDCGCESCPTCNCKKKNELDAKVAGAYKGVFYANDFSYLEDPCYDDCWLGEAFKRLDTPCCGKLDIGGQLRLRHHHELGMKGQRFRAGTDDDFLLTRVRLFGNYKANDMLRFYVEGLYADSSGEEFAPRGIDENFGDFLNFLVDVKLTDGLTARVGRQELLYGAQRTISPLDWANTRRTFEGVRLLYKCEDWAIDGFYTNFVPVLPNDLDEADYNQKFYGAYGEYSGMDNSSLELYYIGFDRTDVGQSLHTIGSRLNGKCECECNALLWELEGAVQFGQRSTGVDQDGEGFITVGLGRQLKNAVWEPTIWFYYDYASENYNQLFPLAHKYLGFIDAVQRQNIESPNVLITAKPCDKMNLLLWYYHFQSNTTAAVPSIGGTPAQNTGKYLGNELDFIVKYTFNPRSEILFGWSHFWRGSKINNPQDADFVYTQWQVNF